MVKRRHTHVGAPYNRIKAFYKEYVLTLPWMLVFPFVGELGRYAMNRRGGNSAG